ncbi:MAG: hypothetical protein WBZ36_00835 [Candidatus Nitrosopolaris sp.]
MTKYPIFTISALIIILLLALCPQNITIESKAFAQLPIPNVKSSTSRLANPSSAVTTNNNAVITIHTTNSIQGNNFNVIKQQVPGIRKAILSNIDNAIFIAKGSVKSAIPVNVNAKFINQLANGRVDTTQGIDMTKRLTATELINAINATTPSFVSHFVYQPARVIVDNQAICSGIASPTKAACAFTIDIHN